jgi:hypothetical protein
MYGRFWVITEAVTAAYSRVRSLLRTYGGEKGLLLQPGETSMRGPNVLRR